MVFPRFPRDFPPKNPPPSGAGHHRGVGAGAAEASRRPRQVVGQGAGPGAAARSEASELVVGAFMVGESGEMIITLW